MTLHGLQIIAGTPYVRGTRTFSAKNPATGAALQPVFHEATVEDVDAAMTAAAQAFEQYRGTPVARIADFLETVAAELEALGDELPARANAETGLPMARLQTERGRMLNGVRLFAALARDGSWICARIDRADPSRQPLPKPDVRTLLTPLGPVVVFGASNFPLAISVAGNDTVSALAAGCPVVVKAHPGHPGTSEMVGDAIARAVARSNLPPGVFSLVHGAGHEVGLALVRHPATRAVAFTGSLAGGRALFDAGASRPAPIPVYAEMGSVNPVIVLPEALAARGEQIAAAYVQSVTLGVGQFCTSPGLVLGLAGTPMDRFIAAAGRAAEAVAPATMLHAGIQRAFAAGIARLESTPGVEVIGRSKTPANESRTEAACILMSTTASVLASHPHVAEEVFGPSSAIVRCADREELERVVRSLSGHLTASLHATPADLAAHGDLISLLETKVGRIVLNGFGTGVEVCAAMHHGGPYPATTDPHFTSIGHAGIYRFARPICYQNFPDDALPPALRNGNPLGIWRLIDGQVTKGQG